MTLLALVALVASVLVWASPDSQAQSNKAPLAVASVLAGEGANKAVEHLDGYLVNPTGPIGAATTSSDVVVTLLATGSQDQDAGGSIELYQWEILTGPYVWVPLRPLTESNQPVGDDDTPVNASFEVPSQSFIDTVSDSDPGKYEITARLTVTDDDGATATDEVTIYLNRAPEAAISLYAGLRDFNAVADADTKTRDLYSIPGVIDGPGENGNADNEWDVVGGAYLALDGYASTDPDNVGGGVGSHSWVLASPEAAPTGVKDTDGTGPEFVVGSVTPNPFGDEGVAIVGSPGVGKRHTLIYRLTVCDREHADTAGACAADNPTLSGQSIIRIVVHDTSAAPELDIGAGLTAVSLARGDEAPQGTVGAISGVDNQFIVDAGSTVALTASVDNPRRSMGAHTFRWAGASQDGANEELLTKATVRVPADAEDGDTIDVSVTAINNVSRLSTTVEIQLLVGTNRQPTAQGVPVNSGDIFNTLFVHRVTDGFQNPRDGSTVTLRGVATDPDGGSLITSWVLREAESDLTFSEVGFLDTDRDGTPETSYDLNGDGDNTDTRVDADAALQQAVEDWLSFDDTDANAAAKGLAALAAVTAFGRIAPNLQEPEEPLVELDGAFTTAVSFEVPDLKSTVPSATEGSGVEKNNNRGTLLLFSVIDSDAVASVQFVYVLVVADDDPPSADAGPDLQVEAGGFARLNGSASSDSDVKDDLFYRWDYVGATLDPLPNQRPPLSDGEIRELTGWVLRPATDDEANEPGLVRDSDGNRYKYIVDEAGDIVAGAALGADAAQWFTVPSWFDPRPAFDPSVAGGKLLGRNTAYPWFDAPDFSGFNDIKLRFRLNARDTRGADNDTAGVVGTDLNGDGDIADTLTELDENMVGGDLNNNGVSTDAAVAANVWEANVGLDLNGDGDALDMIADLTATGAGVVEADVSAVGSDAVVVTVSRRYFSGNVPSPAFCTIQSLGGPSTFPFDADGDGVADVCALNTTRRATVARQNALENLGGVFPGQFRSAVIAVCEDPVFRATDWLALGDEQADLGNDACATERVSPPPAPVDPAVADVFFSGVVTSQDFCTNHSLGGARTYANDIDGDGVADQCSLSTTRREAVARQRALGTFNVSLTTLERAEHSGLGLLLALEAKIAEGDAAGARDPFPGNETDGTLLTEGEQADYARLAVRYADYTGDGETQQTVVGFETRLTERQVGVLQARFGVLDAKNTLAVRYANALLAECRAAGTQDFGDSASALARDECNPRPSTETGLPPT